MEVRVEGLCKSYHGLPVLKGVSFRLERGVTCLMAPSGAGKTTLLRILLGLERPDSGSVSLPVGCRVSAVFQEDRLLEQLDGAGNLRFVLGSAYDEKRARALLARLGLEITAGKPVREYSGGMKRRLALARALLAPSDVLLLDEPMTGLDGENRARALACVREAAEEKRVLLVTHEAADAEALGAKVLRLE